MEALEINHRFWELYMVECQQTHTKPTVRDFVIWLEENYGGEL